jgi:hypothetical protein
MAVLQIHDCTSGRTDIKWVTMARLGQDHRYHVARRYTACFLLRTSRVGNWLRTSLCIRNSNLSELTYSCHTNIATSLRRNCHTNTTLTVNKMADNNHTSRQQCSLPQALVLVRRGARRELEPEGQSLFYSVHFRRLLSGRENCNNKRSGVGGWLLKYTKTIPSQYV